MNEQLRVIGNAALELETELTQLRVEIASLKAELSSLRQHKQDQRVIEAALDPNTLRYGAWIGSIELDDGVYHGKILHIKDLVVYEAEVKARLPEAFENAVHDYIQTCIELGDDNKMITSLQALAEFNKVVKP